ncbi:MAG: hypothetical protein AAFZ49_14865, partial [Cyanobacteria bacterium J06659_2]
QNEEHEEKAIDDDTNISSISAPVEASQPDAAQLVDDKEHSHLDRAFNEVKQDQKILERQVKDNTTDENLRKTIDYILIHGKELGKKDCLAKVKQDYGVNIGLGTKLFKAVTALLEKLAPTDKEDNSNNSTDLDSQQQQQPQPQPEYPRFELSASERDFILEGSANDGQPPRVIQLPDRIISQGIRQGSIIVMYGIEYKVYARPELTVEATNANIMGKFLVAVPHLRGG